MLAHRSRWSCLALMIVAAGQCSPLTSAAGDDETPQRILQGTVVDEAGAAVVGTKVTADHAQTTRETTTDSMASSNCS